MSTNAEAHQSSGVWRWCLAAAIVATAAQLWLVASAGTEVPFMDQWDAEGLRLYPQWLGGKLSAGDLFAAHNEHRIFWTRLLDLGLFAWNGAWDPLLQLAVNAFVKGALAGLLTWYLAAGRRPWIVTVAVVGATLPLAGWHNALWGFQSAMYLVLLFSVAALFFLTREKPSCGERAAGLGCGVAALFAMGAGIFTPLALGGLALLRVCEAKDGGARRARAKEAWPALALLAAALLTRAAGATGTEELVARDPAALLIAAGRALAWPHTAMPAGALAMNAPALLLIGLRLARRVEPCVVGDRLIALWLWGAAAALALAWARGGSDEWAFGVPSRYADFLVLLPLANAGCAWLLAGRAASVLARARTNQARLALVAWSLFAVVGWAGLSVEAWRRVIGPRIADRDAPVRLAREFVASGGDAAVFEGRPRLLVPHPNPEVVRAVLSDPRMAGRLPPSFQPGASLGPGSRAVRALLGREVETAATPQDAASGER